MRAYNVGSDQEVTIRKLANEVVNRMNQNTEVVINGVDNPENVNRYVPSVERIFTEMGVSQTVSLQQALSRTYIWLEETEKYQ